MESPNSPRPEKARKVKGKVKSIFIIVVDIKGIVHNEFILADSQTPTICLPSGYKSSHKIINSNKTYTSRVGLKSQHTYQNP
jgi:hypothetical protein